jgi:ribosomal protein S18 acetylase RimI-like enzyme
MLMPARVLDARLPRALLERIEQAGLDATSLHNEQVIDGWLIRLSPGKAQRARCVNALAPGTQSLDAKLAQVQALFAQAHLPLLIRITPFSQPADLDARLAERGWRVHDDTRVMVLPDLRSLPAAGAGAAPALEFAGAQAMADAAGALRGSPPEQRAAHAQRLREARAPYTGAVWRDRDGAVAACGQMATSGDLVGLYDVVTATTHRRQGLAARLCRALLDAAAQQGARTAYLQVGADNAAARRLYARLGFVDAYSYAYRVPPRE